MFSRFFRSLALDAGAAPGQAAPPAVPPPNPERRADDFTTRMIAQHGTVEHALRAVALRLFTAEDAAAGLTAQVDQYKARLPEGAVVLLKAEAEKVATLKALGTVEAIVAGMKERDTLRSTVTAAEQDTAFRALATAAQVDPEAFVALARAKGWVGELRDGPVVEHGKTVTKKIPHVRPASDEKAPFQPVGEVVKALAPHEQRALALAPTGAHSPGPTPHPAERPTPTTGTPSGDDEAGHFMAQAQAARDARPNPMIPRPVPPAPLPA